MTIKDLYKWAEKNNATNLELGFKFMDDGGYYEGNTIESGKNVVEGNSDIEARIENVDDEKCVILYF